MLTLVEFIGQNQVVLFLLLFARITGLVAFFPFYSHMSIPIVIKTSVAVFLTLFLFPLATPPQFDLSVTTLVLAILSELFLGFIGGIILFIVFAFLQMAGMQISFVMGFTMASVMDPQTGTSLPLISQFFTLIALVLLLAFNGHHVMLEFIARSLGAMPFGAFYPSPNVWSYLMSATNDIFIFGFLLSFPVVGMALLADIIFGMLMKTMPQFNMLVVGFPIRIMETFVILMVILTPVMLIFKKEMLEALRMIQMLFIP